MNNPAFATDPYVPRLVAAAPSEGYLGSSLDLRAGLFIRELRVSALPAEVVSELARMRRSWSVPTLDMSAAIPVGS